MSKSLKLMGGAVLGTAVMVMGAYGVADRFTAPFPENPDVLGALPASAMIPAAPAAPAGVLIAAAEAATEMGGKLGLGRAALPEEVAAWDLDVSPDGTGLPEGSGDAIVGEPIFEEKCAVCHGSFAEGVDNWPKLAGGNGTLADEDPLKTVGSYWPYLSTVWDYVHRSMPFGNAQSLTPDEVYAITAYILYSNDMIADDFVLSKASFLEVEMTNTDGFIIDDRATTEYSQWSVEPCMSNCKPSVEITMKASVVDVTPEETAAKAAAQAAAPVVVAAVEAAPAALAEQAPAAESSAAVAPAVVAEAPAADAIDPVLVAAGEDVFKKCKACHQIGEGAKNRSGPQLNGIVGRGIGADDGFKYSRTMGEMGGVWDEATLAAFLANPKGVVKGTKMSFAGLKSDEDIASVIAYLNAASAP